MMTCTKVIHDGRRAYLHDADDDSPYDVDGLMYCGRCHVAIVAHSPCASSPPSAPEATPPHVHEFDTALPSVDGWLYDGCECGATKIVGVKGPAVRAFLAGDEPAVSPPETTAPSATEPEVVKLARNLCGVIAGTDWPISPDMTEAWEMLRDEFAKMRRESVSPVASSATPTPEPITAREVVRLSEVALRCITDWVPYKQTAIDAIHALTDMARRAAPKPSNADVKWAIRNDVLAHAAYSYGLIESQDEMARMREENARLRSLTTEPR